MTEAESYERYHEAGLEEFGTNERGLERLAESFAVDAAAEDVDEGGPIFRERRSDG